MEDLVTIGAPIGAFLLGLLIGNLTKSTPKLKVQVLREQEKQLLQDITKATDSPESVADLVHNYNKTKKEIERFLQ